MTWLARLKNLNNPGTDATKPTKPGSVGFVAYPRGHVEKIKAANDAKNDAALQQLLAAAMRACGYWSDNDAQREEMRRDVLETPPEDRAWWIDHFNRQYPKRRLPVDQTPGETEGAERLTADLPVASGPRLSDPSSAATDIRPQASGPSSSPDNCKEKHHD